MMKYNTQKGFTLLEVMIAVTLFAIFFTTILGLLSGIVRLSISTKEHTFGYLLAQSKLEEILLGVEEGIHGKFHGVNGFEWEALTENTHSKNVEKIKVRVFWQDREKSIEIETFKLVGEDDE